jgi:adenine-specific DNA-methyltransferase
MKIKEQKPKKSLNKAFLKVKPNRTDIERFKANLIQLLDRTNDTESEEFHKNLVSDFLKRTYYDPAYFINTKGRKDLVIHNGNNAASPVGVIIEAKKPTNRSEMITTEKLNTKAFHELMLYYLEERITHKNLELKQLVISNINEWFIFDATLFGRLFADNKNLVKQFTDFEGQRLSGIKTDFFYKQIAEPFLENLTQEIEFTYFDIRDYQNSLRNTNKADDNKLISLFKLLSPEHLLKLPFTNDSNSLDKRFYTELLHIIGLSETKEGGKKIIGRNKEGERNSGSILEDAIIQLDSLDKISRLDNPNHFGATNEERLFNIALELSITWINRILFLKLLEAQLISYHRGDESFSFLNFNKIKNFDDLNSLFFQVLARRFDERNADVKKAFEKVPYLNSSLFEPTEIEQQTIFISNLKDDKTLPILSSTVLKNEQGKKRTGNLTTLQYLFEFLNAYDFSSEGSEEIQEDNKTLINASVLGLIFEKINGYKEGSFFTPGFITMYMCRETIGKAVIQKFSEYCLNHDLEDCRIDRLEHVYDLIPKHISRKKANEIINSIKICDPAVGSGHFLVSALNEMIAVKSYLKILEDKTGKSLNRYEIQVVNDELIITDEDGDFFEYHPNNAESQRVQETLFHEKQTIIENCLFGVDINPNSVKICRLRLWIELLKNAYYKNATELETLPNIDINIKCGNSLVSRFAIDADLKQALRESKWTIESYRIAVDTYRNAKSKEEKREMEKLILSIKQTFSSSIRMNDPIKKRLDKLASELYHRFTGTFLFEPEMPYGKNQKSQEKKLKEEQEKLEKEVAVLNAKMQETRNNVIYQNSFEWRFEFPEVLDDDGNFVGFDVVIGNPPYGRYLDLDENIKKHLKERNFYGPTGDVAEFFIKFVSSTLLKPAFNFSFIVPKGLSYVNSWDQTRDLFLNRIFIKQAIDTSRSFDEAAYEMMIFISSNNKPSLIKAGKLKEDSISTQNIPVELYKNGVFFFDIPDNSLSIVDKIINNSHFVTEQFECWYGKGGMTPKVNLLGQGIKVLTGKEVQKYYIKKINEKWFIDENLLSEVDINRTKRNKVVVQDIVAHITTPKPHIKLTATTDDEGEFCLNTIMCFASKGELSNEFLVGVINSKLISFYFYYFIFNQAIRTMHFMPGYSDKLPLPNTILFHNQITELVTSIIKEKKINPMADTTELEDRIDQLVYQLYDLTEEEIAIVQNG